MAYIPKQIQGSSVGGFTQGSVPFAAADGTLTEDNSNLFWDDANNRLGIGTVTPGFLLDVSGAGLPVATLGDGLGNAGLDIDGAAGSTREIRFLTAGSARWNVRASSTAEAGANAGSDFQIIARSDAGALLFTPITITRSTGLVAFSSGIQLAAQNIITDTTTGLKIGTATTQKLGFFNATPVVQPADIVDITDNSGGTATTTLAAISNALAGVSCGAVGCNSVHNSAAAINTELGTIRNAVATLGAQIDKIRVVMSSAAGGLGLTA